MNAYEVGHFGEPEDLRTPQDDDEVTARREARYDRALYNADHGITNDDDEDE